MPESKSRQLLGGVGVRAVIVVLALVLVAGAVYVFYFDAAALPGLRGDGLGGETAAEEAPIGDVSTDPALIEGAQVRVLNHYRDSYGIARVAGQAYNGTASDLQAIVIRLEIRDKRGGLQKTMEANIRDVAAGQTRSFDIEVGRFTGGFNAEAEVVGVVN